MGRLQHRLELVATERAALTGAQQQRFGLLDQGRVPQSRVLVGKRHVVALRAAPGAAARLGVEHQRQQAERFGLLRQQGHDEAAEPDGFFGEVAAADLGAGRVGPTLGKGRVDGFEHRSETLLKLAPFGHTERNPGLRAPRLSACADQRSAPPSYCPPSSQVYSLIEVTKSRVHDVDPLCLNQGSGSATTSVSRATHVQ
jgi:hypothetical protein